MSVLEGPVAPELVRGPSAVGGSVRRMITLTFTLAVTDFRLKFFGSILGYLWQVMRPLMLFGVLYVVFTEFVRLGKGVDYYAVVLVTNIVLFTYFAEATGNAVQAVIARENLVRKVQFPRLAIPLSVVVGATFNLAVNLVVVGIFLVAAGVEPRWTWLEVPVLIGALALMATGFATLLSALYVRARDVQPIWDVVLQVAFYASPIIYVLEKVPRADLRAALFFNPLAIILQQMRHALIDPSTPGALAVAGWEHVAFAAFLVVAVFTVGVVVFTRQAPSIAEDL